MHETRSNKISPRLAFLAPAILFLLIWALLSAGNPRLEYFVGSPSRVGAYLLDGTINGWLLRDLGITGGEASVGYFFGNAMGVGLAIALWWIPSIGRIMKPYIAALGAAPLFAASPLLILWFGTGFSSKVAMVILSTVFVALAHSTRGLNSVPEEQVRLVRSFGGDTLQVFRFVAVPSLLTWMASAMRLNIGFAILGAFLGEFLSAEAGLGKRVLVATGLFDMSLVIAGILGLVALAGVFYAAVELCERLARGVLRR